MKKAVKAVGKIVKKVAKTVARAAVSTAHWVAKHSKVITQVGLAVAAVALTVVNVAQLGLDPVTDAAEAADVGALTADVAATTAEETAGEGAAATAEEGSGATVQIFRNVGSKEFDSIASSGRFSTAEGQMEGKWFATQGEHAEQWGQLLNKGEGVTVETRIPQSVADQLYFESGKLDGIGSAYYANGGQLDLINQTMDGIRVWP